MKKFVIIAGVFALAGCAALPHNANSTATSTCAAAAAYGQAIHAVMPQLDAQAHANLEILAPYCTASSPTAAMNSAEANAFAWLAKIGKPLTPQKQEPVE